MDKNRTSYFNALRSIGEVYVHIGRYKEALNGFNKIIQRSQEDLMMNLEAQISIAGVYQKQSRFDEALELISNIQSFMMSSKNKIRGQNKMNFRILEMSTMILKSTIYGIRGEADISIKESQNALNMIKNIKTNILKKYLEKLLKIKSSAYNNLGNVYKYKGEYDKAIKLFKKKLEISHKLKDRQGVALSNGNLGIIYKLKGDYRKAIELYTEYLKIAEKIGDKQGVALASMNLGIVNKNMGEYDKAIRFYFRSLKYVRISGIKKVLVYPV